MDNNSSEIERVRNLYEQQDWIALVDIFIIHREREDEENEKSTVSTLSGRKSKALHVLSNVISSVEPKAVVMSLFTILLQQEDVANSSSEKGKTRNNKNNGGITKEKCAVYDYLTSQANVNLKNGIAQFICLVLDEDIIENDEKLDSLMAAISKRDMSNLDLKQSQKVFTELCKCPPNKSNSPIVARDHPLSLLPAGFKMYSASQDDEEENETTSFIESAEYIADQIHNGANFFRESLSSYVEPNATSSIKAVGSFVQEHVEKCDEANSEEHAEDKSPAVKVTNASLVATDFVRQNTQNLVFGIRDLSTENINKAAEIWDEKDVGKQIVPEDDLRNVAASAGKVGIATLGAAAIVAESLFETTKAVAQTSVNVTADVTTHMYGGNAGKIVKNAGVAAGNILRTMTHVASLEAQVLVELVAKRTAKEYLDHKPRGEKNEKDKADDED